MCFFVVLSSLSYLLHFKKDFGSQPPVSSFQMSSISKPISKFLSKSILFRRCNITTFLRHFSVISDDKHTFTVSYLINSLGLSPKSALNASKFVKFDSSDKPDKTIEFLKSYGFTHTQISSLVRKTPKLLLRNAEISVLPKLEFLESKGISRPALVKALSVFPVVLTCNLENQIIPTYEFIRDALKSDQIAVRAFRRFPDILCRKIDRGLAPNIEILKDHGVRSSDIAALLGSQPRVISVRPDQFHKVVEEATEMGFDPSTHSFVTALCVLRAMSKSTWEGKANVYKKWGWCEEEIMEAFKRFPRCMSLSEDNIMESMDLFVNRVGLRPCVLVKRPKYLAFSLKKRVIPRISVLEGLLSKGLVKEVSLNKVLELSDDKFVEMFVETYPDEAPRLLKLYNKKMDESSTTGKHNSSKLFGFAPSN